MSDKSSFPTRDGIATGKANERQMLERGGMSNEGFRTDLRDNPDGSTTMLRTRGGSPEFSTVAAQRPLDGQPVARGFVAHAFGKSYGALFDPYTLAIEDKRFSIRFATYHVSSVAASAYAPRNWLDVWSWDGATMRINGQLAKTFFPFRFPAAVRQAMPYLRTWPSAPIYGDKWQNSDFPKRIYAVGPESVGIATDPRWAAVIAPLKLIPEAPRSEHKALVCGPEINRSLHEATLAQLYFTGASWDSLVGGWEYSTTKVAMLLTPPYLQATNSSAAVEMARPELSAAGASSGSMTTPITLPPTAIGMSATPSVGHYANYPTTVSGIVYFYWSDIVVKPMAGTIIANYSRDAYTGSNSATEGAMSYVASNTKNYDARSEYPVVDAQSIPLADEAPTSTDMRLNAASDHLFWSLVDEGLTIDLNGVRGQANNYCEGEDVGARPIVSRNYETQNGSFVVSFSGMESVRVVVFKVYSYGAQWVATPNLDYYDSYMGRGGAAEYYGDVSGIGIYSWPYVEPYNDGGSNPVSEYKKVGGVQSPEVCAEINAALNSMVDALMAQTVYQSENAEGYYSRPAPWSQGHYLSSTVGSKIESESSLTWSTRDFLLHDETNGVYITVDGHFEATKSYGASASATLTVVLNIETPWGSGSKVLYDLDYTYSDMLPEEDIGSGGKTAIPSPKIMAVFAPKHREQGTFPGAAYVTQDEVGNGAMPAILVNFVLVLEPYSFIGSTETDGLTHLVPVNLLEMLYAYVFSRKYGIDPYQRYPVSDTAAFNTIMAGLFNVQHHIQFRDGAMDEWLIGLGLPYFTEHKTELSRV